ncbi:MAG: acyltransferase family protein [Ignavibacteriales bacterium]
MGLSKDRDYYFDNLKFILIILVVIGHTIEPLVNNNMSLKAVYVFIYTFHMPLFILVSGYFSKNINTKGYILKNAKKILIPYVIFQILYFLFFRYAMNNIQIKFTLFTPYWIMWFLLSLFIWKMILPYFVKIKYPLLVSIILAVLAGYIDQIGYFMSLSRTITFFPFFLLGYYLNKPYIERLYTFRIKLASIAVLICGFMVINFLTPRIYYGWLYGSSSYAYLHANQWYAGFFRMGIFAAAILFSISVLALVPKNKNIISEMGMRTMYLYLLHGFVIKLFVRYNLYAVYDISLILTVSILVSLFLSSRFVEKLTKPIIQP